MKIAGIVQGSAILMGHCAVAACVCDGTFRGLVSALSLTKCLATSRCSWQDSHIIPTDYQPYLIASQIISSINADTVTHSFYLK